MYIYISHVNVTQTVPDISPLMPMRQDSLLVHLVGMPRFTGYFTKMALIYFIPINTCCQNVPPIYIRVYTIIFVPIFHFMQFRLFQKQLFTVENWCCFPRIHCVLCGHLRLIGTVRSYVTTEVVSGRSVNVRAFDDVNIIIGTRAAIVTAVCLTRVVRLNVEKACRQFNVL